MEDQPLVQILNGANDSISLQPSELIVDWLPCKFSQTKINWVENSQVYERVRYSDQGQRRNRMIRCQRKKVS